MINYIQEITALDVNNSNDSTPNLISGIHLILTATDDLDNISSSIGIYIPIEPSENFIPFETLPKETVESWIANNDKIENAKRIVAEQITHIRADAAVKSVSPPWAPVAPLTEPASFESIPFIELPTIRL